MGCQLVGTQLYALIYKEKTIIKEMTKLRFEK